MEKRNLNKILIVGDSCRGKSTLASKFLQNWEYPIIQPIIFIMRLNLQKCGIGKKVLLSSQKSFNKKGGLLKARPNI